MNTNSHRPSLHFTGSLGIPVRAESESQWMDFDIGERGSFTISPDNKDVVIFTHKNWVNFTAEIKNLPGVTYFVDPAIPLIPPNAILLEDARFESLTNYDTVDREAGYPIYFDYKFNKYHPDQYSCTDVLGDGLVTWLPHDAILYTRPKEDVLEGNYHMWHVFPHEAGQPWKILPNHNLRQLCLKGAERPGGFGFFRTNQIDAVICHPVYEQSAHVLGMQPNQEFIPDADCRMVWWVFDTGHVFVGTFSDYRVLYDFVETRRWRFSEVFKLIDTALDHEFTLNQLRIYNAEHNLGKRKGVNRFE